jgi:hypothetical protein
MSYAQGLVTADRSAREN